ncbi:hypothetical protein [Siminovitchia fortis]|uniref:hypothetical protein n=1 Tax=Siminovitchia fortis TaxID=254758 RepID=UPI0016433EFE|nr:hypothetical protein [Siminovitchia fortis]
MNKELLGLEIVIEGERRGKHPFQLQENEKRSISNENALLKVLYLRIKELETK